MKNEPSLLRQFKMGTPKPRLDIFKESPYLLSKKCRTSTPSVRPPKPPMKSTKSLRIINSSANDSTNSNSEPYCRLFKHFELKSKIGKGDFADVYKAKSYKDNQYYAIKRTSIPFSSNSDRLRKLQEVRNHQQLPPHMNCVRYVDSWEEDGFLYIQTELCKTSLNEVLEKSDEHKLPEPKVWILLLDLISAVKHLHDHDLIHMDIKPDNIFISFDDVAKLGDFGLMHNALDLNSSTISYYSTSTTNNQANQSRTNDSFHYPASNTTSAPHRCNTMTNTHQSARSKMFFDDIFVGDVSDDVVTSKSTIQFMTDDAHIAEVDEGDDNHEEEGYNNNNNHTDEFDVSFNNNSINDHDDSGIINKSDESIDSIDEGDSKYLASETMQGKFTKAADIFSLGITIFEVASGLDLPKCGESYHKLRHNEIDDLYFNGLSTDLINIIKSMMEEDYTKRPTIDELIQHDAIRSRKLDRHALIF